MHEVLKSSMKMVKSRIILDKSQYDALKLLLVLNKFVCFVNK